MRLVHMSLGLSTVALCLLFAGCTESGLKTVPVKGTLTIDGQPANDVMITFSPLDPKLESASGQVRSGAFQLYSGSEGKEGAMVGKYKVVLAPTGAAASGDMSSMYKDAEGTKGSQAPKPKLSFPEKYTKAETSDKEVEVTSGSNDIKIDITSS